MRVICASSRTVLDIGLQLLQLRAAIVDGEVKPPWPVVRNPVPNHVAALQADAARANRPLSEDDRELLAEWEVKLVMPTKVTKERFAAMQEIGRVQGALVQAEVKFREEAQRYARNRDGLKTRLSQLWQQFHGAGQVQTKGARR